MDFFKIKKFGKGRKNAGGKGEVVEPDDDPNAGNAAPEEEQKDSILEGHAEAVEAGSEGNGAIQGEDDDDYDEEDEDDDFITNEVKRRLKEMRKGSFMVLIPEEENAEVEEDGEEEEEGSSSREWVESNVVDGFPLCGFDSLYEKYCQRMLVFDKMILQLMKDPGSLNISKKSPRSASKLASTLRSLSFKRRDELQEDCEQLQQQQGDDDPYQTLETAYVAQVALSWEALHCTYVHLSLIVAAQPDNPTTYSRAAQAFQQFQVLLQRFVENEPFEHGSRVEIYTRSRSSFSKLLQVPTFQGKILGLGTNSSKLYNISAFCTLEKETRVKELFKKKKGLKNKTWPATMEEVQLLFALIDIKVVSRVLRMAKLSKEQLLWCEEKMSKLDLSDNRLRRDGSPILFPC
ncbi:hypothetical protein PR202_ga21521 [Eleusine coracana subsp. coracana]|uniref:Uncharacterized protein n=1 Tax=Eleusine coracana subsp. coracana TaxID=191504 RepID=A0AAV5D1V2_ELECO|nr:hypothetical protein PR202_ga21521 [Eleusine coracana subsp. coracana]